MLSKNKYILFVTTMYLFTLILPFISRYLNLRLFGVSVLSFQMWRTLFIISIVIFAPRVLLKKNMLYVYIYGFVIILIDNIREGRLISYSSWLTNTIMPLFIVSILFFLYIEKPDKKSLTIFINMFLIFITISCLLNIRGLLKNPLAARHIVGGVDSELIRYGVSGYGFHSGLPPLIPALYLWGSRQKNKQQKVIIFLLIAIVFFTVYLSSITAPFVISIIAILASFFAKTMLNKRYIPILSLILLPLLIFMPVKTITSKLLTEIARIAPTEAVEQRILDIEKLTRTGVEIDDASSDLSSAEGRVQRYFFNFEVFLRNPLIGDNKTIHGDAHLFWAHHLAHFGIVGFGLLVLLISKLSKIILDVFDREHRFYFIISLSMLVLMGLMKVVTADFMFLVPFSFSPAILLYSQMYGATSNHIQYNVKDEICL